MAINVSAAKDDCESYFSIFQGCFNVAEENGHKMKCKFGCFFLSSALRPIVGDS